YDYEVYRVTNYEHPFDRYNGEDVIVLDEFRSSLKIKDMLVYMEGYPNTWLPARYGNKLACYTKIYIISNWRLEKQYANVQKDSPEDWDAFRRRINKRLEYTTDGVKEFDMNEFGEEVDSDEMPF
ncbi:MAG: replication protein, partial [Defluviitaleaceae bacterium]|nr:replication protein [Defluviitaleaceae bacterium]